MRRAGFTLIELMVSLVVAGILMAGLVSLSGSVQRAFARNKDITDLQANLRFAMKLVSDDFSRVAYMTSPNPAWDTRTLQPKTSSPAIAYQPASNSVVLRGNYTSSSSTTIMISPTNLATFTVVCRNHKPFDAVFLCRDTTLMEPDPNILPFGLDPSATPNYSDFNARMFEARFKPGFRIQIAAVDNPFENGLLEIATTTPAKMEFTTTTQIDPTTNIHPDITGCFTTVLVNQVTFRHTQDLAYTPLFPSGTNNRFRFVLERTISITGGTDVQEVADFLTAPASMGSAAPGFELAVYNDQAAQAASDDMLNRGGYEPDIEYKNLVQVTTAAQLSERSARAVVITIRGRTEGEDPDFFITGNAADVGNFAVDLDGQPENGMAHVRVERSVVQLPNLAAGFRM